MTEPFTEKHAISTELSNVNREKHKLKSFPLTVYIINNPASPAYRDNNSYEINPYLVFLKDSSAAAHSIDREIFYAVIHLSARFKTLT